MSKIASICKMEPLPLSDAEKQNIKRYFQIYNEYVNLRYEDDPFDAIKRIEYMCDIRHFEERLRSIYEDIPLCVKAEELVPVPPS